MVSEAAAVPYHSPMLPLLFSAYEPSGDRLGAAVIAEVKRRRPEQRIVAFGGPLMQAAGADLLENSCEHAAMLFDVAGQVKTHWLRLRRLRAWLKENPVAALVPVDSPAANWSVCQAVRDTQPQARIVHLVLPQVWAWAGWRVKRLHRLSDHVLCLLPHEKAFLDRAGIPGTFVGHPVFDEAAAAALRPPATDLFSPGCPHRLVVLPGSRRKEVARNLRCFLAAVETLRAAAPDLETRICLRRAEDQRWLADLPPLPPGTEIVHGRTEDALRAGTLGLIKSGTSTLEALAHRLPHVMAFNVPRWLVVVAQPLVKTKTFGLPNLLGEAAGLGRVFPEFCPHHGDPAPIAAALGELLPTGAPARAQQLRHFEMLSEPFRTRPFAATAAETLLAQVGQ